MNPHLTTEGDGGVYYFRTGWSAAALAAGLCKASAQWGSFKVGGGTNGPSLDQGREIKEKMKKKMLEKKTMRLSKPWSLDCGCVCIMA